MTDKARPTPLGVMRHLNPCTTHHAAWIVPFLAAALLQACAPKTEPAGSSLRVYAADLSGGAKTCEVPKITLATGQPTTAAIKMSNDGGWCGLPVHQPGPKPFDAGLLSVRPAYGSVLIHSVGDETRIDYTPDRGFTGTDNFTVKLIPGNLMIEVSAAVSAPVTAVSAPVK
jgi:hypothetical protein